MIVVRPDNWVMDRKKVPTFYLKAEAIKKSTPPPQPQIQKSFEEKFSLVKKNKDEGNKLFKEGNFELAKDKYAETINLLNVCTISLPSTSARIDSYAARGVV